jgi:hypothetical protein
MSASSFLLDVRMVDIGIAEHEPGWDDSSCLIGLLYDTVFPTYGEQSIEVYSYNCNDLCNSTLVMGATAYGTKSASASGLDVTTHTRRLVEKSTARIDWLCQSKISITLEFCKWLVT